MRKGGGKQKGSAWEREVCRRLSLWVTDGQKVDCFWRSAMSGGRATVARGKVRQAGDICAVAPEGNAFADQWFVECKHVAHLNLEGFLIKGLGKLHDFWKLARSEARKYHRDPMIICKQNGWPALVISRTDHVAHWAPPLIRAEGFDVTLFEDILAAPHDRCLSHARPRGWRSTSK